jgi:hypothetical protein
MIRPVSSLQVAGNRARLTMGGQLLADIFVPPCLIKNDTNLRRESPRPTLGRLPQREVFVPPRLSKNDTNLSHHGRRCTVGRLPPVEYSFSLRSEPREPGTRPGACRKGLVLEFSCAPREWDVNPASSAGSQQLQETDPLRGARATRTRCASPSRNCSTTSEQSSSHRSPTPKKSLIFALALARIRGFPPGEKHARSSHH